MKRPERTVAGVAKSVAKWRATLGAIPSTLSRLAHLASLRDSNTGQYWDAGMSGVTEPVADDLIRRVHEQTFAVWLNYSLEQKRADLELHIAGLSLSCRKAEFVDAWERLQPYFLFIPAAASEAERLLFVSDIQILLELISNEENALLAAPRPAHHRDRRIAAVLEAVREAGGNVSLTLKELSQRFRISPRHLGRLFRHEVGTSFRAYLRSVRLRHAATLLRRGHGTVGEIAAVLGYVNVSDFAREFRNQFGVTPAEYRRTQNAQETTESGQPGS
jgi:AraC-like DNA-binding protein